MGQSGQGFTTLKFKVSETFSALSNGGSSTQDATDGTDASSDVNASDTAGSGGQLEFKMQISMKTLSDGASVDISAAMQKFVETLYSALKVLHGADPSAANTLPSDGADAGVAATDSLALGGDSAQAANADEAVSSADQSVDPNASADASTTDASGTDAAASTSQPLSSVSVKLRLTYNSFDDSMGSLVNQLAQPGVGSAVPAVGAMFKDLTDRFSQLLSSAGQSDQQSLNGFLKALASSFGAPAASAANDTAALPTDNGDATGDGTDPSTTDAAAGSETTDVTATPTPTKAYRTAMAEYEQVLSFGSGANASTMSVSMRRPVAFEVA
jgi:hypothetical protein